jgi:hypothetical protein
MNDPQLKNDINAVRESLFATLRGLSCKENPMDIDRAKAICETSQAIINTAKLEVDFMKATGLQLSSGFIPTEAPPARGLDGPSAIKSLQEKGIVDKAGISHPRPGVLVHKIN